MLKPLFTSRYKIIVNTLREIPRIPPIRALTIIIFMGGIIYLCYDFAHYIFNLLAGIEGAGPFLCDKLLNLFFMTIFFLLIFSNAISSYSTVFRSQELQILLVCPLSYTEIFIFKFIESLILTSWAFIVLIGPFLFAYFKVQGLSLFLLPVSFAYLIPYLVIAAVIGTMVTLFLIMIVPYKDLRPYLMFILACLCLISVIYLRHKYIQKQMETKGEIIFFISQLMPYFNFAEKPYLPSLWLSSGIFNLSSKRFLQSGFYIWLLVINAIFLFQIIYLLVPYLYYPAITLLSTQGGKGVKVKYLIWKMIKKIFWLLSPAEKELVIKDLKSIVREPVQYFQLLIFFGILAVYFTNLQGQYYQSFPFKWKMFIAFLNLIATNLVLASLAVRFVFPLISLEGKRMWILNLAPISRWRLLFSKFIGISTFAVMINVGLITISNFMLKISKEFVNVSTVGSAVSALTLIGMIIGLGGWFPNFKHDNPSRIIAGIGGTLALIVSLMYVGFMAVILGVPFYLYLIGRITFSQLHTYNYLGMLIFVVISIGAGFYFLYQGKRNLERMEF